MASLSSATATILLECKCWMMVWIAEVEGHMDRPLNAACTVLGAAVLPPNIRASHAVFFGDRRCRQFLVGDQVIGCRVPCNYSVRGAR